MSLQGQDRYLRTLYKDIEVFAGIGSANYFGDIGGKDSHISGIQAVFDKQDIDLWQTRPMGTVGVRISPYKKLAFVLQLSPIFLSGNDERSDYIERGYAFTTSILEADLHAEYYFVGRNAGFDPYVLGGLGGMAYSFKNNVTNKRSKWYAGNSIILGIGTRLPSRSQIAHSLDAGFHFGTTDFLDGYRTPRNNKDLFFLLTYKINFRLYSAFYYDHKGLIR